MYKHVSHYKLNTRSKCQNPTMKAKDTALRTYWVGARFKYQTWRLCRGLFYSMQVNAPKINGLEISQRIFFKTSSSSKNTFISKYHSTLNTVCSWRSVVKNFHVSTYPPSHTRIYKSYFIGNRLKKKKLFRSIGVYAEAHIRTLICLRHLQFYEEIIIQYQWKWWKNAARMEKSSPTVGLPVS